MTHVPIAAITFVLTRRLMPDAAVCLQYCIAHGYNMVGVVRDDWTEAIRLVRTGVASIIIVADERSLDPDRMPRVEIVAHDRKRSTADAPARAVRTHMVRRSEEA